MQELDRVNNEIISISKWKSALEVAGIFFKLGVIGFGGPAAHIAMMDEELVKKRKWLSRERFLDLLGSTNMIPGPNSTELAIHIGLERAGWLGFFAAGLCFITPAMLIVLFIAMLYGHYQTLPAVSGILSGIKPVIVGIVFHALWNLARTAVRDFVLGFAAALSFALYIAGWNELILLASSAVFVLVIRNYKRIQDRGSSLMLFFGNNHHLLSSSELHVKKASIGIYSLFFTFLKIGSVLYGSGYVLLAFLRSEFIERTHLLTNKQLLDATAVGQITPGPLFTTATFVGYLLNGTSGAIVSTLGIFLPAFVFVAIVHPWIAMLRRSSFLSAALDGVNVASLAFMTGVSYELGISAVNDWKGLFIAVITIFLIIRFKVNTMWLVLGGAIMGYIFST